MFERIIVPLDGSEDGWIALEQAIKIAKHNCVSLLSLVVSKGSTYAAVSISLT